MEQRNFRSQRTKTMVLMALLSAIVAVLAYYGGFIKIGGFASISLTLIPVVIGAALCGPLAGAWLGTVAGAIFFATPDAAFWMGLSIPGTIITVMVKGAMSGLAAGLVYRLAKQKNRSLAVMAAAVVCPVVNTGLFLAGCMLFFMDTVSAWAAAEGLPMGAYLITFFVGLNFVFELIINIVVSPAMVRILNVAEKDQPAV